MAFDIFAPQVSSVSKDMAGKTILVYGSNRTGKTLQGARLPKPFLLPFENGVNGISGVPFLPISKWSDFLKVVKQLTRSDQIEKIKETYQTIIFDTLEAASRMCEEYVCEMYDIRRIAEFNKGFGAWKEFSNELWRPINALTSVGFTVYFIAHDGTREFKDDKGEEYVKIYPRGEKRLVDPVCDLVDIICFLQPNGIDENGNEIKSSAFFKNTRKYHAGSRFDYFPAMLEEFTAENLQKAIAEAVHLQEVADGKKAVDFKTQQASYKVERKTFAQLQDEIKDCALKMRELGQLDKYKDIVENYLGAGGSVMESTAKQTQQLELILDDLKDALQSA
jgi:hypothetical protein